MPVTDLRNILTVPQDAPQNPGFNRTRQLMGMPTDPFQSALAFERAAPGIRANQGMAYLQGIQNHQNEIAQQAQNIRIQQEAQLAAEQATQGLAGANPQSTGWLPQRQQILQQNPNAMLDPRFQNALRIYDQGYSQFDHQRQLQQRQIDAENKQLQGLALRANEYGVPHDVIGGHISNRDFGGLAQSIGEAKRAYTEQGKKKTGAEKDFRDEPMQQFIKASLESLPQVGDVNPDTQKPFTRADISGLAASVANDAHRQFYPEKYAQAEAETSTSKAPPAPATQTGSQLREVLGGGPMASPEEIKSHFDSMIGSKNADENFYSDYIANPNIPLRDKEAALEKFREFSANPPVDQSLTLPQVFARKEEIKKKLSEAEEEVKFQPEREKFNRAWDTSKAGVDGIVERTAKKLGVSKQNLINSLVAGDKIDIPGRDRDRGGISIPQLLAEQWKEELPDEFDQPHQIWSNEARPLTPFKNSPFASKLGTKVGPIPIRQTWGDVLDAYVQDHKKPSASNQPVQNLPRPSSPGEAAKLPAGTQFIGPDGTIRIVPQK